MEQYFPTLTSTLNRIFTYPSHKSVYERRCRNEINLLTSKQTIKSGDSHGGIVCSDAVLGVHNAQSLVFLHCVYTFSLALSEKLSSGILASHGQSLGTGSAIREPGRLVTVRRVSYLETKHQNEQVDSEMIYSN